MKRTLVKLFLFLGLSTVWLAGSVYWDDSRYLHRDWLLLTERQARIQHRTEAGYLFLFGAGISALALAGLIIRKPSAT